MIRLIHGSDASYWSVMHEVDKFKGHYDRLTKDSEDPPKAVIVAGWLLEVGVEMYCDAFRQETKMSISGCADDQLVQQAFADGHNDSRRKLSQGAFFSANAAIFASTCRQIAKTIVDADGHELSQIYENHHRSLLNHLILDALLLIEEWASLKEGISGVYGIGRNWVDSPLEISHAAQQLFFAGSPFFSFHDNASMSSIPLVRVALESRLRYAFGVLGCIERSSGAFLPMSLRTLFEAIAPYEPSISFSVPLVCLRRIYGWSNMYVHTGMGDYTWLPRFALTYLNTLLRGGEHGGGSSANAGVVTSKSTIEAIHEQLESRLHADGLDLWKLPPEQWTALLQD